MSPIPAALLALGSTAASNPQATAGFISQLPDPEIGLFGLAEKVPAIGKAASFLPRSKGSGLFGLPNPLEALPGGRALGEALGIGGGVLGLGKTESAGNIRRGQARQIVDTSPLSVIRQTVLASMPGVRERDRTPQAIAAAAAQALRRPDVAQALGMVMRRGQELGGFGSKQGREANMLGDVLKWTFGLGTVPEKGAPSVDAILEALAGGIPGAVPTPPAPVTPPAVPPSGGGVSIPGGFAGTPASLAPTTPRGVLSTLRSFVAGTPATQGEEMPSFLDAVTAGLSGLAQGVASSFAPSSGAMQSPFVLPGGMPVLGATALGMGAGVLETVRRNIGVPFVDITPSGSSELFEPFRLTEGGARAQVHIQPNPVTAKMEFFGPLGRPVLFSRDVAVARRVGRLARRLGTVSGINRGRSMRRRRGGR